MSGECVRHRNWDLVDVSEQEGGEFYIYARCEDCGQAKSALVDFTRDWSTAGPCPEGEIERHE